MSWLLFIDESGQDQTHSPYEVLAGIAVEDHLLWPLISRLNELQEHLFGLRLFRAYGKEAKAKQLLNRKTFRLASQMEPIAPTRRRSLALAILNDGTNVSREKLTALGQVKIAYCHEALEVCQEFGAVAFASIVPAGTPRPTADFLRKDYAFLFERYYHFLNNQKDTPIGIIVFDELSKVQSHILLNQMEDYFLHTQKGKVRSRLIIPEPLFVHSDLTTMIQMADIIAYVMAWGVRLRNMTAPRRNELGPIGGAVLSLRYYHPTDGGHDVWGFKLISSLLPARK